MMSTEVDGTPFSNLPTFGALEGFGEEGGEEVRGEEDVEALRRVDVLRHSKVIRTSVALAKDEQGRGDEVCRHHCPPPPSRNPLHRA